MAKKCESNCWLLTKNNPEVQFRILLAFGQIIVCHGILTSSLTCHAGSFFFPFSFDVQVFVKGEKKTLCAPRTYRAFGRNASENQNTSFIFSLFVVTVTVTHPASLTLDHVVLPQLAAFESFTISVLLWRRIYWISVMFMCRENDLELKPTSAVKIEIDMTSMSLT